MSIQNKISALRKSLPESVRLVAVSKTKPVEDILKAYEAGERDFGESRPQEMCAKFEALPKDISWHMIGHLQTNKVKHIAPFVAMIQSVDSDRLAVEIDKQATKNNRTIDVLLEIHIAKEESKHGWDYSELLTWLESGEFRRLTGLRIRGIMSIATYSDDTSLIESEFRTLQKMFDELRQKYFDASFDTLSMGMSSDYELAIECGSTMVRVGSAIFEAR